jgi:putative ABC transport system permease protein
MRQLYRTLSFRDLSRRWPRTLLIAACIGLGVATLVGTQALTSSLAYAAVFSANPTSGAADLIVANGELPVPRALERELARIPGVAAVHPRVLGPALAVDLGDRGVLVVGVDVARALKEAAGKTENVPDVISVDEATQLRFAALLTAHKVTGFFGNLLGAAPAPVLVGRELYKQLPPGPLKLRRGRASKTQAFEVAGPVDATGNLVPFAGQVVGMDLEDAIKLFELPAGQVHRFDIEVASGTEVPKVRQAIDDVLAGRGQVRTFAEQMQTTQNVLAGMQTGFSLCGVATLVVGLFLVFNTLSVTVAERRHEIGVLHSLGATRRQILLLFVGEAFFLGILGSLIGLPLGRLLAEIGMGPMRHVISGVLFNVEGAKLYVNWKIYALGMVGGILTTLLAAFLPALRASRERPADVIRRAPKPATGRRLTLQAVASLLLLALGTAMIFGRRALPERQGTLGGVTIVMIGSMVASPFIAALLARALQPMIRRFGSIAWRLGIDDIVRSPGRTGLVIGAVAAGVALVVETAGVIRSNRAAINDWIHETVAADLLVTSGSPVAASGTTHPMSPDLVARIGKLPEVENAMAVRIRKVTYRQTQVLMLAAEIGQEGHGRRQILRNDKASLYDKLDRTPDGTLLSVNFAALHRVGVGDVIPVSSPGGEVKFTVVGLIPDYSWNRGTLFVNRRDYVRHWDDHEADVLHLFVRPGTTPEAAREALMAKYGIEYGLVALTQKDLSAHVNALIGNVYGIAYALLVIVMIVAGLGVVMSLLISVLSRRHEIGLLRAVGATRGQVMRTILAQAVLMGLIGTTIGVIVGIPLEWYILNVVLLEEAGLTFPLYLPWTEALGVAAGAIGTALVAGCGPALHAVRIRIPEAIAYE